MSETFWEEPAGYLKFVTDIEGNVWAHAEVFEWNKDVYYKCKAIWEEALFELNTRGVEFVFVCIPDNDKKLEKFERMFGFEVLENICIPGKIVMFIETKV